MYILISKKIMCRFEAERKELQEKEGNYCDYIMSVADEMVKYKTNMRVMNEYCHFHGAGLAF